jgi:hypothetical protein
MDEPLRITLRSIAADSFTVEVIFDDVGARNYAGGEMACEKEVVRIALAPHAHVTVRVQDAVSGQDMISQDQLVYQRRIILCCGVTGWWVILTQQNARAEQGQSC